MPDTTFDRHDDLSVDQQVALRTAAARLGDEFSGIYGAETIERFLHTSYGHQAAVARMGFTRSITVPRPAVLLAHVPPLGGRPCEGDGGLPQRPSPSRGRPAT